MTDECLSPPPCMSKATEGSVPPQLTVHPCPAPALVWHSRPHSRLLRALLTAGSTSKLGPRGRPPSPEQIPWHTWQTNTPTD